MSSFWSGHTRVMSAFLAFGVEHTRVVWCTPSGVVIVVTVAVVAIFEVLKVVVLVDAPVGGSPCCPCDEKVVLEMLVDVVVLVVMSIAPSTPSSS